MSDSEEIRVLSSEADLGDPHLRLVFGLWHSTRGSAPGPIELDLLSLPGFVDRCVVLRLKDGAGPEEAEVVFAGNLMNLEYGAELTGRPLSDFSQHRLAFELMCSCGKDGKPLTRGPHRVAHPFHDYLEVEHVAVPLSADGKSVTGVFYAAHLSGQDKEA